MKKIILLISVVFTIFISNAQCVSTLTGSGISGYMDGTSTAAKFVVPEGVAVDLSGNVYVADSGNHRIRKITAGGVVTTLAGSGQAGYADGASTSAQFNIPGRLAVDASGNVYVPDYGNHRIRKITVDGVVTTLAGSGVLGFADGNTISAQFRYPKGIAVDASGNIYVADSGNNRIRKITPSGLVNTLAGSGVIGYADGNGTTAQFNTPTDIAVDVSGNVYVADYGNHRIRKITSGGVVTTFAGSGQAGYADGVSTSAQFNYPRGLAVDVSGNVYVTDNRDISNQRIRKITASGVVTTFAGSGTSGYADGNGTSAQFKGPEGVTVDTSGNVYVADSGNYRIRKITPLSVNIGYPGSSFCIEISSPQAITLTGTGAYTGGTYSSNFGLSLNTTTGTITPSTSTVGIYTITYTTPLNNGCQISTTTQVTINQQPTANISYMGSPFCKSLTTAQSVTLTGAGAYTGGTYSYSPSGLSINSSTGAIFPNYSAPGTYTVTYTTSTSSGCAAISRTTQVTITELPTVTISYAGSPFCKSITTSQPVTRIGTGAFTGGTYNASPLGLSINSSTGAITPSTSNPGTYTITYSTVATGGCASVIVTKQIAITNLSANIIYSSSPFCQSNTSSQNVTLTGTGSYTGGTYSSTTGLIINATTGVITPSTSTIGTYTVSYITPSSSGCQITATTQVSIIALPTVSINYIGSPYCKSLITAQPLSLTGTGVFTGGTYTASPSGLSINSSTGAINPSLSTAGTYTVTYTTSTSSGCAAVSTTRQITITAVPTASISYSGSPYCKSIGFSQPASLSGTGAYTGGTYTSTSGLSINASTGEITPSISNPGTYTVTYTTPASGGCAAVSTTTQVTITALPTATLSYSGSPFCKSLTSVQATTTGTGAYTGGTYTSSAGLSISATTGVINPSLSTAGTYTVTYTIPASGGCATIATTTSVVVLPAPTASISADGTIATSTTITNGSSVQLELNGTLNAQPNIQWTPATAISSTSVANPVVYPSATTTYTVSFINSNGCPQTTSFTVNVTPQPNIGNLSLSSSNTNVSLFDVITVNVQLTNATNLYSLYMKLKGNAAVSQYLNYTGHTAGTLLGTGGTVISTPPTVTNGVPDFGITKVGAVPGYSGSGLFYSFTFVPKNISIPVGTTFCFYLDDVSAYNATGTSCGLTNQGQLCYTFTNQVAVWPGDLNNNKSVTTADLLPIGYFYNSTGPARSDTSISWSAHPATLWGYNNSSTSGDAYKVFADSNGDGVITNADQAAIGFNMNQVRARMASPAVSEAPPHFTAQQLTTAAGTLTVTPNNTIINGATLPQSVTFTVNLNNIGGLSSLYGISVNLVFDETVFDLSTETIDYAGSIFGNVGLDCLALDNTPYNSSTNIVSAGLTRFGNAPINGQGLLFKVTIQTKSTLPNLTLTPVTAYVDAANNQAGDTLVVQDAPANNLTIINNLGTNTVKQDEFILYPNPASEVVYLQMGANTQLDGMKVKVVNLLGQVIEEQPIQNTTTELSTKNWGAAGMYFIQITNSNSNNTTSVTKKVMVNRK